MRQNEKETLGFRAAPMQKKSSLSSPRPAPTRSPTANAKMERAMGVEPT
jgi:hypothetical protein